MSISKTDSFSAAGLRKGRANQKQRTRRTLLETAAALIAKGERPTVTEVADAAGISRRTAYRYFPTQVKLMTEAALEGLRPSMESAINDAPPGTTSGAIETRVDALVEQMQRLALANEALLRTMIHETVLHAPSDTQPRGSRRVEWIEAAIQPLRARLGPAAYARLVSGLSLVVGIEALLVLRDIRGLSGTQAIQVSHWMARALLKQSLADRQAEQRRARSKRRGSSES
ncbi:transcriptional regulator, TetR family [Dyella sp. OK004]|uniref:TetR/AcrR family transcriptional regulator n=1 Tax=Dyella sp. OK004 TaxID=1855292 RepID=UPI0008F21F67|nr:TetR/AcrR family transcriptional regulator [Dyella sp. OK004]SFS03751.1 transcriptional regulator, TetR family [Dyella sp. OK004]